MNLPVVFRPIAKQELDESIEWYEAQRVGLGTEFAEEVKTFLVRIASTPEQFGRIRGPILRAVLHRFPFTIHFLDDPKRIVVPYFMGNVIQSTWKVVHVTANN